MAAMEAPAEGADTADVHPAPAAGDDEKTLVDFLHDAQSAALSVKAGNVENIENVLAAIVAALDHEHCHHGHL